MPDHDEPAPKPFRPVNRLYPRSDWRAVVPKGSRGGRPEFASVARNLYLMQTYQSIYGIVRVEIERLGETPEAVRSKYLGLADLQMTFDEEIAQTTREALEDALASRPPKF
jgi:hypothetical protein